MTNVLLVGLGGAAGSIGRYLVSIGTARFALAGVFPIGTLVVNCIGCFAIGLLAGAGVTGERRLLFQAGVLGGFTTFSAFGLETFELWGRSRGLAVLNVVLQVGLGLAAAAWGFFYTRSS